VIVVMEMDLAASLSELSSAVTLLAERASLENVRRDLRRSETPTSAPQSLPKALQGSELQATVESQLLSFGSFVETQIDQGKAATSEFFAGTSFVYHARAVACTFCGRRYFPASIRLHEERCTARWSHSRLPQDLPESSTRFGESPGLRSVSARTEKTETSNTRPARLVCDFGDSVSSNSSDEVELVGAEKQPGSLTPSDEATTTPPPLGSHSSCSETLASEDHSAQQIPWPQKLIGKAIERAPDLADAQISAVPHVPQWRSTSQPCRRDVRRPGPLGPGRHEPKRAVRPADRGPERSELWEPLRKVTSIKDAATQTSRRKPRGATSQTQSQSQRQGVGAAKPVRKPDIGSGLSRSARCKTPRSSRAQASSVAQQGPKPRPSTRVMKNRSYSAPTVSTSQRSVAAAQNPKRRSHSAGPCHHRRCVACLMAEIRSMSWPPGLCARKSRLQKASKSRSGSQSAKTQKPKLYSSAEIRAQKVLEQSPQESPANFQAAQPEPEQSQASRLDGAVQTDSSLFQALHPAENSEFAGHVQQMPEVECVACDEGLDRRLPCIPPSWMCIQEVTCMRKFVGGILRHPMTAESNSNPRAAEPAALVPRPVVEVKVRKKEQRKSRKSLAGQRLRA